ncbi:MAG: sulfur carrier protein ThiS [Deltaproteobacteria bacterium]|nr:sulfur carrier protein ThiS [Deltaproteobacteria bacterium]
MSIIVNGDNHPWREGLTVAQVIEEKKYSFPLKTVFINGQRVPKPDWPTRIVADGDEVNVLHLMSGG